jgi:hypothetical protein
VEGVGLLILVAMSFAGGYFLRGYLSRRRYEQARRWKDYTDQEWPQAANTNQAAPNAMPVELGELGQMLGRWESRARARRLPAS